MVLAATLNAGPLMLYFGQEIGENAAYSEGFSGDDGRTSIFDYWHVAEYQKWVNNGKFNTQQLSKNQVELRNFYQKLNELRLNSKAVANGSFYDLMWANPHLNQDKIYAYLRHHLNEVLLIVINFDLHTEYNLKLKIPADAITIAGLCNTNPWQATELIFNYHETTLYPQDALGDGIPIHLKANGVVVYKLV
jgi:glycosidase